MGHGVLWCDFWWVFVLLINSLCNLPIFRYQLSELEFYCNDPKTRCSRIHSIHIAYIYEHRSKCACAYMLSSVGFKYTINIIVLNSLSSELWYEHFANHRSETYWLIIGCKTFISTLMQCHNRGILPSSWYFTFFQGLLKD